MKNKEDIKYFYQLLSCLQQVVKKLQQQQQQNTFKHSSGAVTVSLNNELPIPRTFILFLLANHTNLLFD